VPRGHREHQRSTPSGAILWLIIDIASFIVSHHTHERHDLPIANRLLLNWRRVKSTHKACS
jgi:hypothetical protein